MTKHEIQRAHLMPVIDWAKRIRAELQPLLDAHGDRVHFRPSSAGVALVGLLPTRPQRGRSGLRNLGRLAATFEAEFATHCRDVEQGRPTPEKALQSFLIRTAQVRDRRMEPLNDASRTTKTPVTLRFVTDEIAVPDGEGGRVVCDLLALRVDHDRMVPVVIELKAGREQTRLVAQVSAYANLVDSHSDLFAALYSALLGTTVVFSGPCERWIVWPATRASVDPRAEALAELGIRVVGFTVTEDGFGFRVGEAP